MASPIAICEFAIGGTLFFTPRAGSRWGQCAEREARTASERDHQENIESHEAHNSSSGRANRHADTDLAAALEDGVVEHSVESDAGVSRDFLDYSPRTLIWQESKPKIKRAEIGGPGRC